MEQMDGAWKFWLVRAWMLAPMPVYVLLALHDARPVDWCAPWIPSHDVGTGWFAFVTAATTLSWADGWLLPLLTRRKLVDEHRRHWERGAFGRFLLRTALFHGAGLWGLLLSFQTHDVRYAIVSLAVSSVMVLLVPRPRSTTQSSTVDEPPSAACA
jgi:hypothetical protein